MLLEISVLRERKVFQTIFEFDEGGPNSGVSDEFYWKRSAN